MSIEEQGLLDEILSSNNALKWYLNDVTRWYQWRTSGVSLPFITPLRPRSLSQSNINSFAPSTYLSRRQLGCFFLECEDDDENDEGGEGGGEQGEEREGEEEEESRFEGGRPSDGEENDNVNAGYSRSLGPIFPSSHQIRILAFTHSSRPGQFSIRTCSLGVSLRVHSVPSGDNRRPTLRVSLEDKRVIVSAFINASLILCIRVGFFCYCAQLILKSDSGCEKIIRVVVTV
ncbi:hypothetical protein DFJ43DRAFT_1039964 [Lentinula guzmanii]|uniref:Uncharacterized protein n=1 Tax=Lentinula guzmanii TaxID=2804957 RepID=A0AA38JB45_9AGAR|nr:hypothetical protein DFJ43DRAFT_1039964 [Lentinula guzmanii]